MRIKACRNNRELRTVLLEHGKDDRFMYQTVIVIGRARRQGDIHGEATAATDPCFTCRSCAGIKRKLVRRYVEHRRVLFKYVLRPVSVVDVDVYDGDSVDSLCAAGCCRNRDVVKETKAHRAVAFRVMPGRPDEGEHRLPARPRVSHGLYARPSGKQRDRF